MFGNEFDYMRISPKIAEQIILTPEYIYEASGITSERRIYYNVEYDQYEESLKKLNIKFDPETFTKQIMLKFLYAGGFILNEAIQMILNYFKLIQASLITLDESRKTFMQKGYIYLAGRDQDFRPTIVVDMEKLLRDDVTVDYLTRSLLVLLAITEEYLFYPGKVENWNIIIDVNYIELSSFPIQSLHIMILELQTIFPQNLNKIYILNPSKSFKAYWAIVSNYITSRTLKKICIIGNFFPQASNYSPYQVEKKYNGLLDDIQNFWPPQNTIQQLDPQQIKDQRIKAIMSSPNQTNSQPILQEFQAQVSLEDLNPPELIANTKSGLHMFSQNPFLKDVDHSSCPVCSNIFNILKKDPYKNETVITPTLRQEIGSQQYQPKKNQQEQTKKSIDMQTQYTDKYPPLKLTQTSYLQQMNEVEVPWFMTPQQAQKYDNETLQLYQFNFGDKKIQEVNENIKIQQEQKDVSIQYSENKDAPKDSCIIF